MPTFIKKPTKIKGEGHNPKIIEEYIGRVNSKTEDLSVAHMKSPSGWIEPGQQPEFDEYAIVLNGMLKVKSKDNIIDVHAGEAVIVHSGEWVQYSTPSPEGAEYIAICLPAFSVVTVNRDV
jgi:mannose-6-phosphate isomerase-like protein (cupin superfamily)